jgi:predicted GIY-YIG superfamily endonuclease
MTAWLYILRLNSGQLYVGSTTDLDQRYKDHCSGKACRTTQLDPPVTLLYSEQLETFSDARRREAQVKRWSRGKFKAYEYQNVVLPIIRWADSPQLGYEILPNKYFYRYQPPTPTDELLAEFWRLEKEAEAMLKGLAQ